MCIQFYEYILLTIRTFSSSSFCHFLIRNMPSSQNPPVKSTAKSDLFRAATRKCLLATTNFSDECLDDIWPCHPIGVFPSKTIWVFPEMVVPPKHPKMVIFSRKTNSCLVPPFWETPICEICKFYGKHVETS